MIVNKNQIQDHSAASNLNMIEGLEGDHIATPGLEVGQLPDKEEEIAIELSKSSLKQFVLGLRTKLIVPYFILTLGTSLIGIFIVTQLVTSSVRERFSNQLLEASRVAADGIVQLESENLANLRLAIFVDGLNDAVFTEDQEKIIELLYPVALNANVHLLTITNQRGEELVSLIQNPDTGQYITSTDGNLANFDIVSNILMGELDQYGDKYASIGNTIYGNYLFTSGPISSENGELLGTMMIGTRLENIIANLKANSLADIVILDQDGKFIETTYSEPAQGFPVFELNNEELAEISPAYTKKLELFKRDYQFYYSPFVIRNLEVGVMAVALPSNFIVSTAATSRNLMSVIFTLGTVTIIVLGYILSQNISKPILRMRDVSLAVASGDLDQRTGLQRQDEIGQLATVFDLMTFRLRKRTNQAAQLYAETRKRNEELAVINYRLQQAQQQLVQSEKLAAVGQLTAGIVHDVKNPLAVIKGLAEEIQEDLKHDPDLQSQIALVRDNATRANNIVSDLLKFARQSGSRLQYQNICETIQATIRLTNYLARKASVEVVADIPNQAIMVSYDSQQIEQVVVNLIQNAIQAMPNGGDVYIRVRTVEHSVEITIRDTGIGIPAENLNRIFDPFFTTKPEGEGTGLGLSVSYGIISEHKGKIEVSSVVGEGTIFTILLPMDGA